MDKIFNIASNLPFLDVLAKYLLEKTKNDVFMLSDYNIILPTNRSIRALKEAFIRHSEGKSILLPKMMTVNSLPEVLNPDFYYNGLKEIPDFSRQFLLAKLIKKSHDCSFAHALSLSSSLMQVLDDFIDYNIDYNDLEGIVPTNYAIHWEKILDFLKIIKQVFPEIMKENGYVDKRFIYNRKIANLMARWDKTPYNKPIIMAGLSYVSPMVKDLFKKIANQPKGMIVLYGLDSQMNEEDFEAINEVHPQYSFKKLLGEMNVKFSDVKDLVYTKQDERLNLLKEAMRPPKTVYKWQDFQINPLALQDLNKIECQDLDEEADVISLILRKTLETVGKRAIVVSLNKELSRMIKGKMQRWGIMLDDSSGYSLMSSKIGIFLSLVAKYAMNADNHIVLLELLTNPFSIFADDFSNSVKKSRFLEKKYLRGKKKYLSLDDIYKEVNEDDIKEFILKIKDIFTPLFDIFKNGKANFKDILKLHISVAEKISAERDNPMNLWKYNDGDAASKLIFEILESADFVGEISVFEYLDFFNMLLKGKTVRPTYGMHPRLDVLSIIESRLQKADVVIVAGLNEESLKGVEGVNPWINKNMKKDLGLISDDFEMGLTALDFMNMIANDGEVYLTRALKEAGVMTNPLNWLLRIETLLKKKGIEIVKPKDDFSFYAKYFYNSEDKIVISEPKPQIDREHRIKSLSVTDLKLLWHDPYAIYAKWVLGLRPLDDLEIEIGAKEFGTAVHNILNKHYNSNYNTIVDDGILMLKEAGFNDPFWQEKFIKYAKWFYKKQQDEKSKVRQSYLENKGVIDISGVKINAKADRIDVMNDDTIRVIDYKTSGKDLTTQAINGYEPQLPIEALITMMGGYKDIESMKMVSALEYWQLDNKEGGKVETVKPKGKESDLTDFINWYKEATEEMLDYYSNNDDAVYISRRSGVDVYSDYDELSRIGEWSEGNDKNDD